MEKQYQHLSRAHLEFLPAALEIQAAPPPRLGRSIFWAVIALFFLAVIWVCFGKVDIVAVAQGKLVPSGQVKVIQPLNTGTVQQIYVKEGDVVKQGQPLIALDQTASEADVKRLQEEVTAREADILRLTSLLKQVNDQTIDITSLPIKDKALFDQQWQAFQAQMSANDLQMARIQTQLKASDATIQRLEKLLPITTEIATNLKQLSEKNLVARADFLEQEKQRVDLEENLQIERTKREEFEASLKESEHQATVLKSEFNAQYGAELKDRYLELASLKQEYIKAKQTDALQIITAPEDGVVEQLTVTTIGGVVTTAQELMRLVPQEQALIVDAGLMNKDIGFVEMGQLSEVKVESFPFTKYGVIDAQITEVSTDAVEHEQLGLLFPVKAALKQSHIRVGNKDVPLTPGMSVSLEIKTGDRYIIEFLLAPVMTAVDEGVRER